VVGESKSKSQSPNPKERALLLLVAAFVVLGAATLTISRWQGTTANTRYAIRLSLATSACLVSFAAAHLFLNRTLPHRDPFLLPTAALLTGWGLLFIGRLATNFLLRQAAWLLVSTAVFLFIVRVGDSLRWLRRFRYTWLLGGLALLAATLTFGVNPSGYGQRLWLGAWGVYFQPSELLKLLMIIFLASYLAEKRPLLVSEGRRIGRWRLPPLAYVGPLLAMFGLAAVLLAWQQDLGAAMLFFFTFLAMLYLTTGQWEYVAAGLALFVVVGLAGYRLSARVALRVDGWLNPWPEAADRTFQIVQSLLAFGAGGVFGQGLGQGSPTYIPAVHTDFVFAAVGEEFGLAGTLAVIGLYGVLLWRGFRIAASRLGSGSGNETHAPRPFEGFLAAGLTAGLVIQAWVIMAGNAKLAPIAGVTLPFMSYGGSSLLISFIALGLLLRISSPANDVRSKASEVANLPTHPHAQTPLLHLAGALSLALALLAATCGYWAVVRAEPLRARGDNPRRVLYERRVVRGRILDREETVLASTEVSDDGSVTRRYPAPETAPAVGYASLRYGTGGIEAAFDSELRGEAGQGELMAAWSELLHRPPHGTDVQLTLDVALQTQAQEALAGGAGAVVLLDAATGDVLALASNPTFNPERLDEDWERLSEDPSAPLVNRATQGLYQPGAALQTIVVAEALRAGCANLADPVPNATASVRVNGTTVGCSAALSEPGTLADAYAAACPMPVADLGECLGIEGIEQAIARWGFTTPPRLEIPTVAADWVAEPLSTTASLRAEAIGQGSLTVSPLQMALVAGTLANDGRMPAPRLVLRVQDAAGKWQEQPALGEPRVVVATQVAGELLSEWQRTDDTVAAYWGTAIAGKEQPPHTWFLGVAPADAPRYAVAVLLEHPADRLRAAEIGKALLGAATSARSDDADRLHPADKAPSQDDLKIPRAWGTRRNSLRTGGWLRQPLHLDCQLDILLLQRVLLRHLQQIQQLADQLRLPLRILPRPRAALDLQKHVRQLRLHQPIQVDRKVRATVADTIATTFLVNLDLLGWLEVLPIETQAARRRGIETRAREQHRLGVLPFLRLADQRQPVDHVLHLSVLAQHLVLTVANATVPEIVEQEVGIVLATP
jgi:cell division protein FtsW (lipid II flippase)/cell division protein FtsI/penicillin-binding protein 2